MALSLPGAGTVHHIENMRTSASLSSKASRHRFSKSNEASSGGLAARIHVTVIGREERSRGLVERRMGLVGSIGVGHLLDQVNDSTPKSCLFDPHERLGERQPVGGSEKKRNVGGERRVGRFL